MSIQTTPSSTAVSNYTAYARQLVADTDGVRAAELEQSLDYQPFAGIDWGKLDYPSMYLSTYAKEFEPLSSQVFWKLLNEYEAKARATQEAAGTTEVLEIRGTSGSIRGSLAQAEEWGHAREVYLHKRRVHLPSEAGPFWAACRPASRFDFDLVKP